MCPRMSASGRPCQGNIDIGGDEHAIIDAGQYLGDGLDAHWNASRLVMQPSTVHPRDGTSSGLPSQCSFSGSVPSCSSPSQSSLRPDAQAASEPS